MPPRKKTKSPSRTPGFTTTEKEIHDRLDQVKPTSERVYRKLQQRVNAKRGDHTVFPEWDTIMNDTGIKNRNTLSSAIKELESVDLIRVTRGYNVELKRKNKNQYYIVPAAELRPSTKIVPDPVSILQKPSIKIGTITRMKGTSMNITRKKKGSLKKKERVTPSPLPISQSILPGAINQDEQGQYQNRTGSPARALSVEEIQQRQSEWDKKHVRK